MKCEVGLKNVQKGSMKVSSVVSHSQLMDLQPIDHSVRPVFQAKIAGGFTSQKIFPTELNKSPTFVVNTLPSEYTGIT